MSQAAPRKPLKTTHFMRRIILYAALALVFFLLGFMPMWLRSREATANLETSRQQLSLAGIQNHLGSAAIAAGRGDYEPALQSASSFFTALRAETGAGAASALSPAQIAEIEPLFVQQDDLIALLARRDPASAQKLSDLYTSYRLIVK
ncbi:MAG: hypothetical protein ABI847_15145 [Anaerolineales bacterium]